MRGSQRVIEALNELLTLELTAINQYLAHSKMCENWGYRGLAKRLRDTAMEEMKDAEAIIERILFLDGVPNMQRLGPVSIGESPKEQLEVALRTEHQALELLSKGIAVAVEEGDNASREFFASRLPEEEEHVDWLETHLALIGRIGEELYLSQQIGG